MQGPVVAYPGLRAVNLVRERFGPCTRSNFGHPGGK